MIAPLKCLQNKSNWNLFTVVQLFEPMYSDKSINQHNQQHHDNKINHKRYS